MPHAGCKIPQADLVKYLEDIVEGDIIISDCSVRPTKYPGYFVISTTDFFYPLVDDPYVQGRIGCANVLSDMYSMGVPDCDNMLMLLASSEEMPKPEREIVTKQLMKGFNDLAMEAKTHVTGGQSVRNPWPIIGGVAMTVRKEGEFIMPVNAVPGDVLVLTKPIGTQLAVNAHQWLMTNPEKFKRISGIITAEEVKCAYEAAAFQMQRLNRNGALMMQKHGAHAATDVTGFGLNGHAMNLAKDQKAACIFEVDTVPVLRGMVAVDNALGNVFELLLGNSAETSGGLLACVPADTAPAFCKELEELDGAPAWIVGRVLERPADVPQNLARFAEKPKILEV